MGISTKIKDYLNEPGVSIDEHSRRCIIDARRVTADAPGVYLDMCFWIALRKAELSGQGTAALKLLEPLAFGRDGF